MKDRNKLFDKLKEEMVSEPKIYQLDSLLPLLRKDTGNKIHIIDFSEQPGAHYRGVFVRLIERLENIGLKRGTIPISPETAILVEPTTGNGGEDFVIAANKLGYEAVVVMPDGMPESRYHPMEKLGGTVIGTSKEDYALGMRAKLVELLNGNDKRLERGEKIFASPNHCGHEMSDITTCHMAGMIDQYMKEIEMPLDFAVFAMGNGSSLYGPGRRVKELFPKAKIYGIESVASGLAFDKMYPGRYKELFGIHPAHPEMMKQFKLYGTNAPLGVPLPAQDKSISEGIVDEIILVSDDDVYLGACRVGVSSEHQANLLYLTNWHQISRELINSCSFGNSSVAVIAASLEKLKNKENQNALCVVYDNREKYI